MNELLKKEIDLLPDKPGSYQMRDKDDNIIYIGKAKNLKKRVSQYFLRSQNGKTAAMVFNVDHFTTIVTETEKEALILEMNLIQKYYPKYNILLMDDKHYPYICIHKNVKEPYVSISRNTKDRRCVYFGPYPNSGACYEVINIINKIFKLRKCSKIPNVPCLYYHMHQCYGPCINKIDPLTYANTIDEIERFLNGDNKDIVNQLKKKIVEYSNNLDFELANDSKKLLESIVNINEKQHVEFIDKKDRDFIGFATKDNYVAIVFFIYRKGILSFKRTFTYEIIGDLDEFIFEMIYQYYSINNEPKEIIIGNCNITNELSIYLKNAKVICPIKGRMINILSIINENAKEALDEHFLTARLNDNNLELLETLGKVLNIKTPLHIELFDNSHLQGTNAIGAMVSYINGEPCKKMYRKFNIHSLNKSDDVNSMKEVLNRRYLRLKEEHKKFPDLIILDGGKTQLEAGIETLKQLNIDIPLVSLVKSDKHKTSGLLDKNFQEYYFDDNKALFFLLTRMQDEVHRYAITTHIKKRNKSMFNSIYDNIKGIGERRKELLIKAFPSLDNLKNARLEEIEQILPKDVAIELFNKIKGVN